MPVFMVFALVRPIQEEGYGDQPIPREVWDRRITEGRIKLRERIKQLPGVWRVYYNFSTETAWVDSDLDIRPEARELGLVAIEIGEKNPLSLFSSV